MGWIGFLLVGGGALTVWAGFQQVPITDVIASVLQGKPIPRHEPKPDAAPATAGSSGYSGADGQGVSGQGVSGGGGGTW